MSFLSASSTGNFTSTNLIDLSEARPLFESFYQVTGYPARLPGTEGDMLLETGCPDIYTKFHSKYPETNKIKKKDEKLLKSPKGQLNITVHEYISGLTEIVIPIEIDGSNLASIIFGPFYRKGEKPSEKEIRQFARQHQLDEGDFLEAARKVKSLSEEEVEKALRFYMSLANMIAKSAGDKIKLKKTQRDLEKHQKHLADLVKEKGYEPRKQNLKLQEEIEKRAAIEEELRSTTEKLTDEIHERQAEKKHEEALKNALNLNKTIVQNSPVGKAVYNASGQCIMTNQKAAELLGVPESEILKQNFLYLESWKRSGLTEEAMRIIKEGGTARREIHLKTSSGKNVWLDCHYTRFLRDNEPHLLFIFNDISLNRNYQQQLNESRQRVELATEAANAGVWDWKPGTKEVFFSVQWKRQVGYEDHELKNEFETWKRLLHPDDFEKIQSSLKKYLEYPDGVFIEEFRMQHKNGSYRWIRNQASCLMDAKGRISRMFGVHIDITTQKQTEEKLRNLLAELERSNKELEQFAYVASHDLQEPLRMVSSFLQLLERKYGDKVDDDGKEFIRFAVDGAARMKVLINDLLTFSRVGTRGKPFVKTNMNTVIRQVLDNLSQSIANSDAEIQVGDLPVIEADESQMIQLFQNLVGNAMKFRGSDTPKISIQASKTRRNVKFSVSDNGIGINPKFADRIFIIFQRLHAMDKYPGTGIGLAVCKKITDRHKGEISVKSAPGKGSTFTITIPRNLAAKSDNNNG